MEILDWNKISDKDKKKISKSKSIFTCGSRDLSEKRILQLTKQLGSKKNLVWGCLKDDFIEGFEGAAQFRTLKIDKLQASLKKIAQQVRDDIILIQYFQRDWKYVLKELDFSAVILINGSWYRMLHLREEFWIIVNKKVPYKLVSPFVDEQEAEEYAKRHTPYAIRKEKNKKLSDEQIMKVIDEVAKYSFATDFQTSCALIKNGKILITTYNKVVPFETYALHNGSVKEKNFSPPNDLNHYDTNHAEVEMLIKACEKKIDLKGTSLYINLLPCPTCARMLCSTKIKEIVYKHDHSDGYAYDLLTKAGKEIRRII